MEIALTDGTVCNDPVRHTRTPNGLGPLNEPCIFKETATCTPLTACRSVPSFHYFIFNPSISMMYDINSNDNCNSCATSTVL
jgi:hypothetical protein